MPSPWWPGGTRNWDWLGNMEKLRRWIAALLCLLLVSALALPAAAMEGEQSIARDLIAYYFHYRDKASEEIENQLQTLSSINPEKGDLWRQIMTDWAWINEEMTVTTGALPDGLPEDDSLCIVVLGYGLEKNGDMKPELLERLEVALKSAEKYPESYVLCTGGETANVPGISEAGQMGNWLLSRGLPHNRLILETESLSTTENARNSCRILWKDYPQVKNIAIVSSDYHIRWGSACFNTMMLTGAAQGKPELDLAGNAGCVTSSPNRDTMYSQAWGVSIIADTPFDSSYVPPLYMTEQTEAAAQPEAAAVPVAEPVLEEAAKKEPVIPVLMGLAVFLLILFGPKKRKRSDSD